MKKLLLIEIQQGEEIANVQVWVPCKGGQSLEGRSCKVIDLHDLLRRQREICGEIYLKTSPVLPVNTIDHNRAEVHYEIKTAPEPEIKTAGNETTTVADNEAKKKPCPCCGSHKTDIILRCWNCGGDYPAKGQCS